MHRFDEPILLRRVGEPQRWACACGAETGTGPDVPPPSEDGGTGEDEPRDDETGETQAERDAYLATLADERPATTDELAAAYLAQIEHTNLVRAEYQARLAAMESRLAFVAQERENWRVAQEVTHERLELAEAARTRAEQERAALREAACELVDSAASFIENDAMKAADHMGYYHVRAKITKLRAALRPSTGASADVG